MIKLTRRQFLRTSGSVLAGIAVAASGCSSKPAILKGYPDVTTSRVVRARHSGAWDNRILQPAALEQMLDASITRLTGLSDSRRAWKTLFKTDEKIAIKVNTINGSSVWTPVPLVNAVVEKLKSAGIPPENIYIYDRDTYELTNAGFSVNKDGPGVRCIGTDMAYERGYKVQGVPVGITETLLACDALINMPVIKQHMMAGISFALKNHYGTFDNPSIFHYGKYMFEGLPELNNLPDIKDRTRLVVGSSLSTALGDNWEERVDGDSIFLSYDPVAVDTIALQVWKDVMTSQGRSDKTTSYEKKANTILANAASLNLGTNDMTKIEYIEEKVA